MSSFEEALREPESCERIPLKQEVPFEGEFWILQPPPKTPKWRQFVYPLLQTDSLQVETGTVSALLFIKVKSRILVITFGYGRNLLKLDAFELGFGLKTALNNINHEQLRSLDLRTYEDLVVSVRKQTSRNSDLAAFGLDISRDLLRAVTGKPESETFGDRITGADALVLNLSISPLALGQVCEMILGSYQNEKYKRYFEWIDHLKEIRDTARIDLLNAKLLDVLKNEELEKLHFAPPEPIDWQSVECFRMGGTRDAEYDDLSADEYIRNLGARKNELSIDKLKKYEVQVKYSGQDQFQKKWSVFNCIVWEDIEDDQIFALVEGKWFEIEKVFSKKVAGYIKNIPVPSRTLPPAKIKEHEGQYNQRLAQENSDIACLDCKLIKPEDAASSIEFCDLVLKNKSFIHVKRKTRSATLSHLFSQGTVSGRVFLYDGEAREQVRKILESAGRADFLSFIPRKVEQPDASKYEVNYAIITRRTDHWPLSLPFFSQLNLMQNTKILRGMGYSVTLQQVDEE